MMSEQFELFRPNKGGREQNLPARVEVTVDGVRYSIVRGSDGKLRVASRRGGIGYAFGGEDIKARNERDKKAIKIAAERLDLSEEGKKAS